MGFNSNLPIAYKQKLKNINQKREEVNTMEGNKEWRRGQKAPYTDRPLTEQEKRFAEEHHDLMYRYMRVHKLDLEEWYDRLIIPYLQAVKKYHEYEYLRKLEFEQIFFRTLDNARSNYFRAINRKKRKPIGGLYSYDSLISDETESTMEYFLVDVYTNVEKQVLLRNLLNEFYDKCIYCDDDLWGDTHINGYLKCELDLLLEGYSIKQVNKRTEKVYPHGYNVKDLEGDIMEFRKIFKEVFGI